MEKKLKAKSALMEVVVTALIAVVIIVGLRQYRASNLLPADGTVAAPEMHLKALSGKAARLSELNDKPVLLHFWAPW